MADPRHSQRPTPASLAIRAASDIAARRFQPHEYWQDDASVAAAPHPHPHPPPAAATASTVTLPSNWDDEPEYEDFGRHADEDKLAQREREARRDEMQYKTAFRTAFELGVKAGRMQRVEPLPCAACQRRKERNRIAAQASRLEKRRMEQALAGITVPSSKRRRATTGNVPAAVPAASSPGNGGVKQGMDSSDSEEEECSSGNESEGPPPPF